MQTAITIAEYFINHAFIFFDAMASDDRGELSAARILLEELRDMTDAAQSLSVSRRDLQRRMRKRSRFKESKSLDAPLARLESHGFIQVTEERTGGRPSKTLHLNPLVKKAQKAQKAGSRA